MKATDILSWWENGYQVEASRDRCLRKPREEKAIFLALKEENLCAAYTSQKPSGLADTLPIYPRLRLNSKLTLVGDMKCWPDASPYIQKSPAGPGVMKCSILLIKVCASSRSPRQGVINASAPAS